MKLNRLVVLGLICVIALRIAYVSRQRNKEAEATVAVKPWRNGL